MPQQAAVQALVRLWRRSGGGWSSMQHVPGWRSLSCWRLRWACAHHISSCRGRQRAWGELQHAPARKQAQNGKEYHGMLCFVGQSWLASREELCRAPVPLFACHPMSHCPCPPSHLPGCPTSCCPHPCLCCMQVSEGPGLPPAAVGGFPHTLRPGAGQRVDVTGHVCCAFAQLLQLLERGRRAEE